MVGLTAGLAVGILILPWTVCPGGLRYEPEVPGDRYSQGIGRECIGHRRAAGEGFCSTGGNRHPVKAAPANPVESLKTV